MEKIIKNFKLFLEQENISQRSVEKGQSVAAASSFEDVVKRVKQEAMAKVESSKFKNQILKLISTAILGDPKSSGDKDALRGLDFIINRCSGQIRATEVVMKSREVMGNYMGFYCTRENKPDPKHPGAKCGKGMALKIVVNEKYAAEIYTTLKHEFDHAIDHSFNVNELAKVMNRETNFKTEGGIEPHMGLSWLMTKSKSMIGVMNKKTVKKQSASEYRARALELKDAILKYNGGTKITGSNIADICDLKNGTVLPEDVPLATSVFKYNPQLKQALPLIFKCDANTHQKVADALNKLN